MSRHQRHRRHILWIGSALGALLWLVVLILPGVIAGHITGEQPAGAVTSR